MSSPTCSMSFNSFRLSSILSNSLIASSSFCAPTATFSDSFSRISKKALSCGIIHSLSLIALSTPTFSPQPLSDQNRRGGLTYSVQFLKVHLVSRGIGGIRMIYCCPKESIVDDRIYRGTIVASESPWRQGRCRLQEATASSSPSRRRG